jgi:hypothetical protein
MTSMFMGGMPRKRCSSTVGGSPPPAGAWASPHPVHEHRFGEGKT